MSAPKKNAFWKHRRRHGRPRPFGAPEGLWEAACRYFQWCDDNPWYRQEQIKSGKWAGTVIQVPTQRPYTLTGLSLFLGRYSEYFRQFKKRLKDKTDEESRQYLDVIDSIENLIYTQQFEGAVVGIFNPKIIARQLGLMERKEVTSKGESINQGFYDFLKQRRIQQKKAEPQPKQNL